MLGARQQGTAAVAIVNGQAVTLGEFEAALKHLHGSEVLRGLTEQKVVIQEARRQQLSLEPAELERFKSFEAPEGLARVAGEELQSRLLLRKLLVKDIPDERKRYLYQLFREELTQYELFGVPVASEDDARSFHQKLTEGVSFENLAHQYSTDPGIKEQGGRIGLLTLPQIHTIFGPEVAKALGSLQPGQVSDLIHSRFGPVLVKVGEVRSSYAQLEASIEDLVAESQRLAFLHRLVTQAKIKSEYPVKLVEPTPGS